MLNAGSSGLGSLGMTSRRSGTVGSSALALVLAVLVFCVSGGNGQPPQVFTTMFTSFAGPNNVRVLQGGQQVQLLLDQVSGMLISIAAACFLMCSEL